MQRGKTPGDSKIPSSASRRLRGRIWAVGDGAFAPESWVRSASRYHFFIRMDSRHSRGCSKTAEDCHFYNGFSLWLRAFE
jgi:hypothetical protein